MQPFVQTDLSSPGVMLIVVVRANQLLLRWMAPLMLSKSLLVVPPLPLYALTDL